MLRRITPIIVLTQLLYSHAAAQQDQAFRINSINADSTGYYRSVYSYPEFTEGTILSNDGKIASALLNYKRLSGQILFINSKGDTLEFSDPGSFRYVAISEDTFYFFDKAYLKLISHYNSANLYKKEKIEYNGKEKKGAYGGYSSTSAANSIDKISDENDLKKIAVDENTLYVSSSRFYLRGAAGKYYPAVKKNFVKMFPQKEKQLNNYLANNKVNYRDENDLLRLLDYLQKE
jgi:hypothetical protein